MTFKVFKDELKLRNAKNNLSLCYLTLTHTQNRNRNKKTKGHTGKQRDRQAGKQTRQAGQTDRLTD